MITVFHHMRHLRGHSKEPMASLRASTAKTDAGRSSYKINSFDRYFLGFGEIGMIKSTDDVKIYFVTIPAHKFLHIKNYESNGYWDFWQKQSLIPGRTVKPFAAYSTVLKASWMTTAEVNPTAAAARLWLYQRSGRQALRLGLSSHRVLWRTPSHGLSR